MDLINSYLGTAQTRGMPQISYFFQDKAGEEYITIPLIILCLIPFVGLIKPLLKNRAKLSSSFSIGIIISLFATIVGFWGFFTNSDSNLVAGLPLIFICPMILLSWVIKNEIIDIQLHPGYSIAVLFSLFAVFIGLTINNVSPFTLPLTITQSILWKACLMIVFTAILFSLLDSRKWSFVLAFMILIISIAAICVGQGRLRVKYIGPFYTDSSLIKIQNIPFFDNYDVSPQLGAVVGDIKLTLAQYNKKDLLQQKIFFGPRIQFAYAAFHINSPTKLPVWFHPGVSYSLQDSQKVIDSFVEHKFDLCIFARYGEGSVDFTYLPGEIINALNRNYKRIDMTGVVVYKLNSNITKEIQ